MTESECEHCDALSCDGCPGAPEEEDEPDWDDCSPDPGSYDGWQDDFK